MLAGSSRSVLEIQGVNCRSQSAEPDIPKPASGKGPWMTFDNALLELNYRDFASQLLTKLDILFSAINVVFLLSMLKIHLRSAGLLFPSGVESSFCVLLRCAVVLFHLYFIWRMPLRYIRLRTTIVGLIRVVRFLLATWHGSLLSARDPSPSSTHHKLTGNSTLAILTLLPLSTLLPVPAHVLLQSFLVLLSLSRISTITPNSRLALFVGKRLCVAWGRLAYWPRRIAHLPLPPTSTAMVPDEAASRVVAVGVVVLLGFLLPTVMHTIVEIKLRASYASSGKNRRNQQGTVGQRLATLREACARQLRWTAVLLVPALFALGVLLSPASAAAVSAKQQA